MNQVLLDTQISATSFYKEIMNSAQFLSNSVKDMCNSFEEHLEFIEGFTKDMMCDVISGSLYYDETLAVHIVRCDEGGPEDSIRILVIGHQYVYSLFNISPRFVWAVYNLQKLSF